MRAIFQIHTKPDHKLAKIRSIDNLADLFIKSLLISTFKKLIYKIGIKDLDMRGSIIGC